MDSQPIFFTFDLFYQYICSIWDIINKICLWIVHRYRLDFSTSKEFIFIVKHIITMNMNHVTIRIQYNLVRNNDNSVSFNFTMHKINVSRSFCVKI